jgi:hypothetical protein
VVSRKNKSAPRTRRPPTPGCQGRVLATAVRSHKQEYPNHAQGAREWRRSAGFSAIGNGRREQHRHHLRAYRFADGGSSAPEDADRTAGGDRADRPQVRPYGFRLPQRISGTPGTPNWPSADAVDCGDPESVATRGPITSAATASGSPESVRSEVEANRYRHRAEGAARF